jgi:hypothetical protein
MTDELLNRRVFREIAKVRAALNELVHEGAVVYSQQLFCYQIAPGSPGPDPESAA